jgi:broad specificity polyphosphatase/5'/3'-nucleotidase SurE
MVLVETTMSTPTILVTNDEGIGPPGLWAVVEALLPLGQIVVAAPERQWAECGRCMPTDVTCAVQAPTSLCKDRLCRPMVWTRVQHRR